jgi:kinetochore protein Nuf2
MAAQYSFPTLENREILECMSELGCSLSEEQLTKPTPDHIMRVMEQLLDLFMGFSADDNAQIKFSGMDVFDHPEIHEFSVGQLAFHRSVIKLMRASGVYDFELKDISMPQHARIRKLFSAVINFAKFREEKVATFENFVESTEALQNQKADVDMRFEQLTEQLNQLRAQRKQEEVIIDELQVENEKMEEQIRTLNHEQSSLKTKIHETKQVRQELSDKRDSDQFVILNLRAEIAKLQNLVVRSPERVKKEIAEMSNVYESDHEILRDMDSKLQTLRTKVDGLNKTEKVLPLLLTRACVCKMMLSLLPLDRAGACLRHMLHKRKCLRLCRLQDVSKVIKLLKDVEENMGKLKGASKEVKRLQGSTEEAEDQIRDLSAQEASLQRQVTRQTLYPRILAATAGLAPARG